MNRDKITIKVKKNKGYFNKFLKKLIKNSLRTTLKLEFKFKKI